MTQPTTIYFGPDGSHTDGPKNKVYLRTHFCSTAKRGKVIETIHVALQRNESKQNFNIWVYGDKGDLKRGSGLFVPQEGVTFDHHFLQPSDGASFAFLPGLYKLIVFAKLIDDEKPRELMAIQLSISESQASELNKPGAGLYFDWGPEQQIYHPHIKMRCEGNDNINSLLESMCGLK